MGVDTLNTVIRTIDSLVDDATVGATYCFASNESWETVKTDLSSDHRMVDFHQPFLISKHLNRHDKN
jgi:hypothetical protein